MGKQRYERGNNTWRIKHGLAGMFSVQLRRKWRKGEGCKPDHRVVAIFAKGKDMDFIVFKRGPTEGV